MTTFKTKSHTGRRRIAFAELMSVCVFALWGKDAHREDDGSHTGGLMRLG